MISYEENEKKFNFRVGAIIESPDKKKILIHKLSHFDFWLLPGGRVEMMEDTEKSIVREIKEELGVKCDIDKLISITENFFTMGDKTYHEIAFNYLLKVANDASIIQEKEEFAGIEGEKYRYKWIDKDLLGKINFKPDFIIPILQNMPKEIIHIIKDDRK